MTKDIRQVIVDEGLAQMIDQTRVAILKRLHCIHSHIVEDETIDFESIKDDMIKAVELIRTLEYLYLEAPTVN